MFPSQEAYSEDSSQSNLLTTRHLKFPKEECRHATRKKILDDADNACNKVINAFIEAYVVNAFYVGRGPLDVDRIPVGVEGAASNEEHQKERDHVGRDESNAGQDSPPEHSGDRTVRKASIEKQNGDFGECCGDYIALFDSNCCLRNVLDM